VRWEATGLPATASLFLRGDLVIAAGETVRGSPGTETLMAITSATGELRWSHSLRSAAGDPDAVEFSADDLRIVAAENGVFLSPFSASGRGDPVVGFSLATGSRLFPSDGRLEESRTIEELVGATDGGLVSNIGVLRNTTTGIVTRLKQTPGDVLGVAGNIAFTWDTTVGELAAYDITDDEVRWAMALPERPSVVVLDDDRVVIASSEGWQLVTAADGEASELPVSGLVDTLNTFIACTPSSYQSVPIGRLGFAVACDGRFIAVPSGTRVDVIDVDTGNKKQIAACDPADTPFAVASGVLVCGETSTRGKLSLRFFDAASGLQLLRFDDDDRPAPAGLAMQGDQVVVSLIDGTFVSFELLR
jgi:outer membrane protein assembly factor BamB